MQIRNIRRCVTSAMILTGPSARSCIAFLVLSLAICSESESAWSRLLVPIGHGPPPGVPFTIRGFSYLDATLSANGWYCYTQGRDSIVLHGREDSAKLFHPVVRYEVATKGKTDWRRLRSVLEQKNLDIAAVSPDNPIINVAFDMEPLREWIGTYRYGRVVLENGDAAVVALEDLLPDAAAHDASGNYKEDIIGGDAMSRHGFKPARANDPAVLSSVISLGGQLIGEFIFDSRSQVVNLKGTKTSDGDFWPTVIFSVSNSDKSWKKIGKPKNNGRSAILEITNGKAEKLRITLTNFEPQITKYKYGKIVFSNGESTIFYLDLLRPKGRQ